jgi:hypothetical protein
MVRTHVNTGPSPGLDQGLGILSLGIPGPYCEQSGPLLRGPGPVPGVWFVPVEVLNLARRSGLCIQGSGTSPWGSGLTVATLEYIVSSGHVAASEPPTWRGRVLFTARLEISARAPCLHTVVRGTPDSRYRQWPPGPPQGRIQACRWGQSLTGDWCAAFVCLCRNHC